MEKDLREDEIKELEEEIDSAVDRLFVENQKGLGNSVLKSPPSLPPSFDPGHASEPVFRFEPPPISIPPTPSRQAKPLSFGGPDELEGTFDFEPSPAPVAPKPGKQPKPVSFDALDELEGNFDLEPSPAPVVPKPGMQPKPVSFDALDELEGSFDLEPSPAPVAPEPIKQPKPVSFDTLDQLEGGFDLEPSPAPVAPKAGPHMQPPSYLKSIDQLEAQLLSLEWEISPEKLQKTREEVGTVRELLKQRKDIESILGFMGSVLDRMIADEENIDPASIKFLLDAKETIKLSFEREDEREFEIYKSLAREGIEARFRALGGVKKPLGEFASSSPVEPRSEKTPAEKAPAEKIPAEWKKVEELLPQWNHFFERAESLLQRIEQRFSELEKRSGAPPGSSAKETLPSMDITVFKSYGKLYGVESQKIMKLYKVPLSFEERYGDRPKVRIKGKDVTLVDLKKMFPDELWLPAETSRLLMIQGEGKFKGLIVEEVLKRIISSPSDRGKNGKPVLGLIHWNYQAHPVEVPILDVEGL
jgi:hypothetical protein